jgi:hypothetical protein
MIMFSLAQHQKYLLTDDPFLLPGRLTIKVDPRIPATALESIANFVILSDSKRIALVRLFASRSITCLVAYNQNVSIAIDEQARLSEPILQE